MTIKEAAQKWVEEFNAIPQGVVEKLIRLDRNDVVEITPPRIGDRVYIFGDEWVGESGEITESKYDEEDDLYAVELDSGEEVIISSNDFEVERDKWLPMNGRLPMWGTMWSFDCKLDEDWLTGEYCEPHLQEMADCGFRIYEQEDYGIIFGIDGAGYDFYESHWIPLYRARGLKWHDKEE